MLPVSPRTVAAPAFQVSLPALRHWLGWKPRARLPWFLDHWTVPCLQQDLVILKRSLGIGNQWRAQCCKSGVCSHQAGNCQGSCRAELLQQVATVLTFNLHDLIGVLHHLVLGLVAEGVSPGLDEVQDLTADTRLHLPLHGKGGEKPISEYLPETQRVNNLLLNPLKRSQKYHTGKTDFRILRRGKSCQKPVVRTMQSIDSRPLQLPHCPLQHKQQNVLRSSTDQLNRAVALMLRTNAQQLCPPLSRATPPTLRAQWELQLPSTAQPTSPASPPGVLKAISGYDTVRTAGTAAL